MSERWLPLVGFKGAYSVSSQGRFRLEVDRQNKRAGSILSKSADKNGYALVSLRRRADGPQRVLRVARLVLRTFAGPARGRQANHKNGVRNDDRLENLEYATCSENIRHAIKELGRDYRGEKNPDARLTEEKVLALRHLAEAGGLSFTDLGARFGVSGMTAAGIATGKMWAHVGGPRVKPPGRGRRPNR